MSFGAFQPSSQTFNGASTTVTWSAKRGDYHLLWMVSGNENAVQAPMMPGMSTLGPEQDAPNGQTRVGSSERADPRSSGQTHRGRVMVHKPRAALRGTRT